MIIANSCCRLSVDNGQRFGEWWLYFHLSMVDRMTFFWSSFGEKFLHTSPSEYPVRRSSLMLPPTHTLPPAPLPSVWHWSSWSWRVAQLYGHFWTLDLAISYQLSAITSNQGQTPRHALPPSHIGHSQTHRKGVVNRTKACVICYLECCKRLGSERPMGWVGFSTVSHT